jgi:hypothetical protein
MSRFRNAWRALMGELPLETVTETLVEKVVEVEKKVTVPVIGDAVIVKLYATDIPTGETEERSEYTGFGSLKRIHAVTTTRYYLTCALAHQAAASAVWPGGATIWGDRRERGSVKEVSVLSLGGEYFPVAGFAAAIKVEPKPKRAKGAK